MNISAVCVWGGGRRTVKNSQGQYMPGITKILKRYFYPKYSWKKATNGPLITNFTKEDTKQQQRPKRGKKRRRRHGAINGKIVDRQVICANVLRGDLPETKQFKAYLRDHNLVVITNQFPVCNEELNLCTCVDVLAFHPVSKKYFLLELKTGYRENRFRHTGFMKPPYQTLTDCPLHQHYLQLLLSSLLFKHNFPCKNYECRLIYASSEKYQEHKIPNSIVYSTPALIRFLEDKAPAPAQKQVQHQEETKLVSAPNFPVFQF